MTPRPSVSGADDVGRLEVDPTPQPDQTTAALARLDDRDPGLARILRSIFAAIADEAATSPRFAKRLKAATAAGPDLPGEEKEPRRRGLPGERRAKNRRAAGVLDPFSIYAASGAVGLRDQLQPLNLEQLRDIVAEHAMDQDRLAMKWKDAGRVIDRIIDRVAARAAKGSAFRGETAAVRSGTAAGAAPSEADLQSAAPSPDDA